MKNPLFALLVAVRCSAAAQDAATWNTTSWDKAGMKVGYPTTMRVDVPGGETCTSGACKPVERLALTFRAQKPDGDAIVSVDFAIQRQINPNRLPIQKWYENMARRPLDPNIEKVISVGGKPALRRRGQVSAQQVKYKDGKAVSNEKVMTANDTFYVQLNDADVLSISNPLPFTPFDETFKKIMASIQFTPTR